MVQVQRNVLFGKIAVTFLLFLYEEKVWASPLSCLKTWSGFIGKGVTGAYIYIL